MNSVIAMNFPQKEMAKHQKETTISLAYSICISELERSVKYTVEATVGCEILNHELFKTTYLKKKHALEQLICAHSPKII